MLNTTKVLPIPNLSNLPSQAEVSNKRNSLPHSHSIQRRQHNFDPFLVSSESDSDNPLSTPTKANPPVRPLPSSHLIPLASLPDIVRTFVTLSSSPTPAKALAVPRPHGQLPIWDSHPMNLSRSIPSLSSDEMVGMSSPSVMTLQMPRTTTRLRLLLPLVQSPSVIYDDSPRTAPLTSPRSGFGFDPKPTPRQLTPRSASAGIPVPQARASFHG
jgi:hypothetical protein